jgi:hypothetical protein
MSYKTGDRVYDAKGINYEILERHSSSLFLVEAEDGTETMLPADQIAGLVCEACDDDAAVAFVSVTKLDGELLNRVAVCQECLNSVERRL